MSKTTSTRSVEVMEDRFPSPPAIKVREVAQPPRLRAVKPVAPSTERVASLRVFSGHFHRLAVLALVEMAVVALSTFAAFEVRFPGGELVATAAAQAPVWVHALLAAVLMVGALAALGLYQLYQRARLPGVMGRVLIAVVFTGAVLAALTGLFPALKLSESVLALSGFLAFCGLCVVRLAFLRVVDEDFFKRRVMVWGSGRRASAIAKRLRRRADGRGFRILGYVGTEGDDVDVPADKIVRADGDLLSYMLNLQVEEIVVAMDDRRRGFPEAFLRECRLRGIAVRDVVSFLEKETGRVSVELAQPNWLIFSEGFRCSVVGLAFKRLFDILVSLVVLVVALPVALVTAIAILVEDGGPVLYRQIRTGRYGRAFWIIKFRSMRTDAESNGSAVWAGQDDPRVTRVGRIIRKLRIDELPQVLNVLAGHMSFVGPRPERPEFVESLSEAIPFYQERHFVKPGITGWAQVRCSYGASVEDTKEKLGYDLYYVAHGNLLFDLKVLFQTVEIVFLRIGSR